MTLRIMFLYMLKLRRILESRYIPIQMPQPLMQIRVPRANVADISSEVLDVNGVETDDCGVEADICFGDCGRGEEVWGC